MVLIVIGVFAYGKKFSTFNGLGKPGVRVNTKDDTLIISSIKD
jgi:hypothetical protein